MEIDDVRPPDAQNGRGGVNLVIPALPRSEEMLSFLHDAADLHPKKADDLGAPLLLDHVFGDLKTGVFGKPQHVAVDENQLAPGFALACIPIYPSVYFEPSRELIYRREYRG